MSNSISPTSGTGPLRETIAILERKTAHLQRMLEISQSLTSTLDIDSLLSMILEASTELTDTEAASIMLLDEKGGELIFAASTGSQRDELARIRVPLDGSIAGTVLRERAPLVVGDPQLQAAALHGLDGALVELREGVLRRDRGGLPDPAPVPARVDAPRRRVLLDAIGRGGRLCDHGRRREGPDRRH